MLIVEKVESSYKECDKLENAINNTAPPKKLFGQQDSKMLENALKRAKTIEEGELAWMIYNGETDEEKKRMLNERIKYKYKHGLLDCYIRI